ncbi:MAG: MFS transporter [Desulfobacteraceae bacterium]|nr:MFS transporter [Desulfobacteraceae bacterium]
MLNKIFYGWWIVLATSLIHFWGAGTFFYSFTAFFNPLVEEFGWSYAATSFAASLRSIEGGIASPLVGMASDRFGARRLLIFGSILSGSGFLLFSQVRSLWSFYLIFVFLSVGSSFLFPVPGWTAVANWFVKKRGTALGVVSAAIGLGGGLIYGVNTLINVYGWRATLVIIGIGTWVIGIPSSLIVRHRPEPYGLWPDGERSMKGAPTSLDTTAEDTSGSAEGFSLGEALRTKAFWAIALAVTVSAATVHAVMVHVMPYLISVDFSREKASLLASLLVFVSIVGRFGFGSLSNRMDNRYLLALGITLQALGLMFLAGIRNLWLVTLFIACFGPGYGGVITLRLTLQAEYFGRRAFGTIQGLFMAIAIVGTISSPLLTGMCYDLYGDYRLAWFVMAAANLAVVPFALKLRPPKKA